VVVQADGKIVVVGTTGAGRDLTVVRLTSGGQLDSTFGNGGEVAVHVGAGPDEARGVVVQADGKIVVVGSAVQSDTDFALLRLNPDGGRDTTFGNGGVVTTNFGGIDTATSVALQSDGKLVAAGSATYGRFTFFALARYNTDGSLDTSFGAGTGSLGPAGTVTTSVGAITDVANALTIQPNGKIVLAGRADRTESDSSGVDFALVRYDADGTPDANFGINGQVVTRIGSGASAAAAVGFTANGKLVAAGTAGGQLALTRYLADLRPVAQDNTATINNQPDFSIAVLANDFDPDLGDVLRIKSLSTATLNGGPLTTDGTNVHWTIPAGTTGKFSFTYVATDGWLDSNTATVTFNVSATGFRAGDQDISFAGTGFLSTAFSSPSAIANAVALQSNGMIVAAGSAVGVGGDQNFALARYNPDGTPDPRFGTSGELTFDFAGGDDVVNALVILPNGQMLVGGYATFAGHKDFALARINANGTLDTTFGPTGSGGKVLLDFAGGDNAIQGLAVDALGRIVVAGYATISGQRDFALARFTASGALDTTFGTNGRVTTDFGFSQDDEANGLVVQSDGKIVVAGVASNNQVSAFGLARYTAAGVLDTTFGVGTGSFGPSGTVTTNFLGGPDGANAIALQSDGKLVVAGFATAPSENRLFAAARYNADGTLDSNFGSLSPGLFVLNVSVDGMAETLAVQADGKIVLGGFVQVGVQRLAFVRLTSTGFLDPTFGSNGRITYAPGTLSNDARALVVQPDGNIVGAGTLTQLSGSLFNPAFVVFRLHDRQGGPAFPLVLDNAVVTNVGQPVTVPVLSFAQDPNGAALTVTRLNGVPVQPGSPVVATADGTVILNADGTVTYTPQSGFAGTDSFQYTVSNGTNASTATVRVSVQDMSGTLAGLRTALGGGSLVTNVQFDAVSSPTATGTFNGPLPGFDASGGPFALLTTGDVSVATTSPSVGVDNGTRLGGVRGLAFDPTVLRVNLNVPNDLPAGMTYLLSFDFAFDTNEYPNRSREGFGDGFVAELDNSTWSVDPLTGRITAPNNFAFDARGQAITPNSSFFGASRVTTQTGTQYNGGTPVLQAHTAITPGAHTLYLSLLDVSDGQVDSAVFLRNLRLVAVPTGQATSGATEAPVAPNLSAPLPPGQPVTVSVLSAVLHFDNVPVALVSASAPQHGTVTVDRVAGTVTYTPNAGATGSDSFTYTVSDPFGGTATGTVSLSSLVASSVTQVAATGGSASAAAGIVQAMLSNTTPGSAPEPLTVAGYTGNPTGVTLPASFGPGTAFFDVQVTFTNSSDRVTLVVADPGGNGQLMYFTGIDWEPVFSSGNAAPLRLPDGSFLVVLDATSEPRITGLTGNVFTLSAPAPSPPPTTVTGPTAQAPGLSTPESLANDSGTGLSSTANFQTNVQLSLTLSSSQSSTVTASRTSLAERPVNGTVNTDAARASGPAESASGGSNQDVDIEELRKTLLRYLHDLEDWLQRLMTVSQEEKPAPMSEESPAVEDEPVTVSALTAVSDAAPPEGIVELPSLPDVVWPGVREDDVLRSELPPPPPPAALEEPRPVAADETLSPVPATIEDARGEQPSIPVNGVVEESVTPPQVVDRVFALGREWLPPVAPGLGEKALAGLSAAFLAAMALAEARRDRQRPCLV
jgi:uncharacterized delta-60 repeat protein